MTMFNIAQPAMTFEGVGEFKDKIEVFLVNPGEVLRPFGGSDAGLLVRKTASLVIRSGGVETVDTEYDIRDQRAWSLIQWANENCDRRIMGEGTPR